MLRRVVFIRAVLVILPRKHNESVARFHHGLLLVEMVDEFSFGDDKYLDIVLVRMIKRRRSCPDMKRKILFRFQYGIGARPFHAREKVVRIRAREKIVRIRAREKVVRIRARVAEIPAEIFIVRAFVLVCRVVCFIAFHALIIFLSVTVVNSVLKKF